MASKLHFPSVPTTPVPTILPVTDTIVTRASGVPVPLKVTFSLATGEPTVGDTTATASPRSTTTGVGSDS